MPRLKPTLSLDLDSEPVESSVYDISEVSVRDSPVLSQMVPNPESRAEQGYGIRLCDQLLSKSKSDLGSGTSGRVYGITWDNVIDMVSPDELFDTSHRITPDTQVAVKILKPLKEILQRIPSYQRDDATVANYLREYSKRCTNIYRYMETNNYFGIPRHLTVIYACSYCFNTPVNQPQNEMPSMLIASELIDGENMGEFLFTRDWSTHQLLSNVKNILIQGISIIMAMYHYNFYHNDLSYSNIFIDIHNTSEIRCEFPILKTTISLVNHQPGSCIPLVKFLDYDLATVGSPRNAEYQITDPVTKLPIYDFLQFVLGMVRVIHEMVNNQQTIGETGYILDTLHEIEQLSRPLLSERYFSETSLFTRSRLSLNTSIDDTHRIAQFDLIIGKILQLDES
jgi:serine/threonine protein kinase